MGEVKAFRARGEFPIQSLIEIANNPDIEGVQIICHWKATEKTPGGEITVGWTPGISNAHQVYGARVLQVDLDTEIIGHRHNSDEIDY